MPQSRGPQPANDPGEAAAEAGLVLLDGPAGVAIAMTPECAEATAARLCDAAAEARRQREEIH